MRALLAVLALALPPQAAAAPAPDPCLDAALQAKAASAQALDKEKKYVEAEAPAREVLAACATHATGVAALGESLVGQKRYDDAISALTSVITAKPDVAYAYFWRAQAYYGKKLPGRMVSDYETFLKLAPTAPEAATVRQLLGGLK